MPLDAASGGISLAEDNLANMLADSAAFRTWCGAADAAAARQRIYFDALPPPKDDQAVHSKDELVGLRPFAIVYTSPQNGYRKSRAATGTYPEMGVIGLQLEQNVPDKLAGDPQQLMRQFKNNLGAIIDDLDSLAYQAGYLAVNTFDVGAMARELEDAMPQQGDNLFAFLIIGWGVEQ